MADGFFCDTCGTCVCVCVCVLWLSHLFVSLQLCVLCVHFGEGTSTVVGFVPCTSAQTVPQAPGAQILRLSQSMAAICVKGNASHAVRTQCEVLNVGHYSDPIFGPFWQVFGSILGFFSASYAFGMWHV